MLGSLTLQWNIYPGFLWVWYKRFLNEGFSLDFNCRWETYCTVHRGRKAALSWTIFIPSVSTHFFYLVRTISPIFVCLESIKAWSEIPSIKTLRDIPEILNRYFFNVLLRKLIRRKGKKKQVWCPNNQKPIFCCNCNSSWKIFLSKSSSLLK